MLQVLIVMTTDRNAHAEQRRVHCSREVPADAEFCPKCAAKLVVRCGACDTPNGTTDRFCKKCGTSLSPTARALHVRALPVGAPSVITTVDGPGAGAPAAHKASRASASESAHKCPSCHSTFVKRRRMTYVACVLARLTGLRAYVCCDCDRRFYDRPVAERARLSARRAQQTRQRAAPRLARADQRSSPA